jgi:hypothetical protein
MKIQNKMPSAPPKSGSSVLNAVQEHDCRFW